MVVKYVIDGEVIVLEILTSIWTIAGHCPRKCETVSSPSPHIGQALVLDLRMVWTMEEFVKPTMSRDEVHCSSLILSVVAECSVKIFDDVDAYLTECQFGVSRTIS